MAPVLGAIGNKSVDEQATLTFTATATDPDLPAQTLTYSLDAASLAAGMTINASTGAFSWTPTEAQGGATLHGDGHGHGQRDDPANLTDAETITITVGEVNVAPVLGAIGNKSVDEQATLAFTATATRRGPAGADADVQPGRGVAGAGDDDQRDDGRVQLDADARRRAARVTR